MKNLLTALALLISLNGCNIKDSSTIKVDGKTIHIVIIDSCEYIEQYTYYGHYIYSHKGNCSNPIHKFIHQ